MSRHALYLVLARMRARGAPEDRARYPWLWPSDDRAKHTLTGIQGPCYLPAQTLGGQHVQRPGR